MTKRPGRVPKKQYDPESMMQELMKTVVDAYRDKKEIQATAKELNLLPQKVKKLLITAGEISYQETSKIQNLQQNGYNIKEIAKIMGISSSSIHSYLPYSKIIYKMDEISQNAERVQKYKQRKKAVDALQHTRTPEMLRKAMIVFQEYPFNLGKNESFTYTLMIEANPAGSRNVIYLNKCRTFTRIAWEEIAGYLDKLEYLEMNSNNLNETEQMIQSMFKRFQLIN